MTDADWRSEYLGLHTRVETFWLVCREALGETFQSEANWTCNEVEALQVMLAGIADDDDIETLASLHAVWEDTPRAGDCDCGDGHHDLWLAQWGPPDHVCNTEEGATDG